MYKKWRSIFLHEKLITKWRGKVSHRQKLMNFWPLHLPPVCNSIVHAVDNSYLSFEMRSCYYDTLAFTLYIQTNTCKPVYGSEVLMFRSLFVSISHHFFVFLLIIFPLNTDEKEVGSDFSEVIPPVAPDSTTMSDVEESLSDAEIDEASNTSDQVFYNSLEPSAKEIRRYTVTPL